MWKLKVMCVVGYIIVIGLNVIRGELKNKINHFAMLAIIRYVLLGFVQAIIICNISIYTIIIIIIIACN